jgi:hypothetical protein
MSLPPTRTRTLETYKMNLTEIGWGGMDWIDLAQDWNRWQALESTVMNLPVP